jgi:hypothetical protein
VVWLGTGASLPTLHAHVYGDHDHPEHHHGPAVHTHARAATARLPVADAPAARIGPCEPGEHAIGLAAALVAGPDAIGFPVAPVLSRGLFPLVGEAPAAARRDVRAHSPPRLTDGPLRAPPALRPA